MPLVPAEKLIELAKAGPALTRPPETRQSYPIPLRQGRAQMAAFLYAPQGRANPVEGLHLLAPTHLAFLNAETGRFESIRQVTPTDFGQAHTPGQDIGAHRMPTGLVVETFYSAQHQLFAAYDLVWPAFAAGQSNYSPAVRVAAAEFRRLFTWLAEAPLMPYYHAVGREFFTWVTRIPTDAR
jgi:hypothetical protein